MTGNKGEELQYRACMSVRVYLYECDLINARIQDRQTPPRITRLYTSCMEPSVWYDLDVLFCVSFVILAAKL